MCTRSITLLTTQGCSSIWAKHSCKNDFGHKEFFPRYQSILMLLVFFQNHFWCILEMTAGNSGLCQNISSNREQITSVHLLPSKPYRFVIYQLQHDDIFHYHIMQELLQIISTSCFIQCTVASIMLSWVFATVSTCQRNSRLESFVCWPLYKLT